MKTEKVLSELKFSYESAIGFGMVENQSKIMEAMKFIDDNYYDYLDEKDVSEISKKYRNSISIQDAIKRANVVSFAKRELLNEIKGMYELQVNPHRKEIKNEIFESIDWIRDNMPDTITLKEIDIISDRYKYSGEIMDAIDALE
jgi:hypothetical protein